jgi:hypothetical protein
MRGQQGREGEGEGREGEGGGGEVRPRGYKTASMRMLGCVRADAIFTVRTRFLLCPRVNADAGGRSRTSIRKGRPDGHCHPKTSVMTSLIGADVEVLSSSRVVE